MSSFHPDHPETVFTYGAPGLKFGVGFASRTQPRPRTARRSSGADRHRSGGRRYRAPAEIAESLRAAGIETVVFDRSRVEPTDAQPDRGDRLRPVPKDRSMRSSRSAAAAASTPPRPSTSHDQRGRADGLHQRPRREGQGAAQSAPPADRPADHNGHRQREHDDLRARRRSQHVKTGISHARLRPTLAVVDPELTLTQPAGVTAAAGSTSCATRSRATPPALRVVRAQARRRARALLRVNPIADMWSEKALSLMAASFRTAVRDGDDLSARTEVAMAATFAGLGFGNAGVHIPHANAYPSPARSATSIRRTMTLTMRWCRMAWRCRHRTGRVPLHVRGVA